jgi:hypothetical protein
MDSPSEFTRPTLNLVITDDEPFWAAFLQRFFVEQMQAWGLQRTNQFVFKCEVCSTVNAARARLGELLRQPTDPDTGGRNLVYATLDLQLPLDEGDAPDTGHGLDLLAWCIANKVSTFEFCLISASSEVLDRIYREHVLGEQLHRSGVKRVYKNTIKSGDETDQLVLEKIWPDLRDFVRRHVRHCVVRKGPGDATTEHPEMRLVWFGGDPSLSRLLYHADALGSRSNGGVYLIFSDAGGYETDWFRLICQMRGLEAVFRGLGTPEQTNWDAELRDPPPALMINQISSAADNDYDLAGALERHDFFGRARERGSLVFFQFPFLDSRLSIDSRLDRMELQALWKCQQEVYGRVKYGDDPGTGFALPEHPHVFPFPSYETIKQAGVVRRMITFHSRQCQQLLGLPGVTIDPEVTEVLAEMPWDELGLSALRNAIDRAYRDFPRAGGGKPVIGVTCFPDGKRVPVRRTFENDLGFRVRGKRLYHLLASAAAQRPEPERSAPDGVRFLEALRAIHEVFDHLRRLDRLKDQLSPTGLLFTEDFQPEDYAALANAYSFLNSLFESPDRLLAQIDAYEAHAASPDWASHFPCLQDRADWLTVSETTRFQWPLARFPLHWAVDAYLQHNGIFWEIHTDVQKVLQRFPRIAAQWRELELRRSQLLADLYAGEEQRRRAERAMLRLEAQPVVLHVDPTVTGDERLLAGSGRMLQALVFFNAYLAVCENHYRFGGRFAPRSAVTTALAQPELGPSISLLRAYFKRLKGRQAESVFRHWGGDWASARGQSDALRLASHLAERILSRYQASLVADDKRALEKLNSSQTGCPGVDLLDALRVLRNTFDKPFDPSFWDAHRADLYDLVRRFVAATSPEAYRLGCLDESGRVVVLWSRRGPERRETVPLNEGPPRAPDRLYVLEQEGGAYRPLFPVGDLMCLRPGRGSLWVYYSGGRWRNLTSLPGSEEEGQLVEGDANPWLPRKEEVESSPVWRSGHE